MAWARSLVYEPYWRHHSGLRAPSRRQTNLLLGRSDAEQSLVDGRFSSGFLRIANSHRLVGTVPARCGVFLRNSGPQHTGPVGHPVWSRRWHRGRLPGFPGAAAGWLLNWFVWVFVALLCVIGFQLLPLPGLADPAWSELAKFGISKTGTISVAPADTVEAILPLALPRLMFLTTLILFQSDESAVRVFGLVAVSSGVITVLALLQFLVTPNMILLTELPFRRDGLSAFVINRNNAAPSLLASSPAMILRNRSQGNPQTIPFRADRL